MGGLKFKTLAVLAMTLFVAACAERTPPPVITPPVTPPTQPPVQPSTGPNPVPVGQRLSELAGWETSDAFIALEALRSTCTYKKGRQYANLCQAIAGRDFNSPEEIKTFLDHNMKVEPLDGQGTLTGYFVPDYPASYTATEEFSQPVRPRPADLETVTGSQLTPAQTATKIAARKVDDTYVAYYSRAEIEQMPVTTNYYMRPEDYFFMQLQGSGFLDMPDGKRVYAAYAADNGRPFVGIAKIMVERGLLAKNETSGDNIHAWLAAHRGPEAQDVMNANPRYAFFVINPTQTEPNGAAGIPLPPGSAIAVDPAHHAMGDLYWIDANAGTLTGAFPIYQRVVAALDTGGAIKGRVRADLYVGAGKRAGTEAGRIKHVLRMYRIVPFTP